jgi:sirohydrochlorin cobaltochelatase
MAAVVDPPALLLIAHGTRDPRGAAEMDVLLGHVRERVDAPVAHGWLEDFAAPGVVEAAAALVQAGARRIVAVPFLNFAAGHAKYDIPRELAAVRAAHPEVEVATAEVLGLHPALVDVARQRVTAVSDAPPGEVLVVAASGSNDPDANGDVAKAARLLAEATGHRWVELAFAGVTWPAVDEVVPRVAAAGAERVALFSWSLLAGLLEQRVAETAAATAESCGVELRDAGRFGPDPLVADAIAARYRAAAGEAGA